VPRPDQTRDQVASDVAGGTDHDNAAHRASLATVAGPAMARAGDLEAIRRLRWTVEGTLEAHVNNHHRDTVAKIFSHPANRNVEWRQVRSLLEAIGTVTAKHDGKLEVTVGPEREVFTVPRGKDVDVQMLVDLRRMLGQAGYGPDGGPTPDLRSRDHGDGQWGAPT